MTSTMSRAQRQYLIGRLERVGIELDPYFDRTDESVDYQIPVVIADEDILRLFEVIDKQAGNVEPLPSMIPKDVPTRWTHFWDGFAAGVGAILFIGCAALLGRGVTLPW